MDFKYLIHYYSVAFVICASFYLAFCITDLTFAKPTEPKIVSISVIDDDGSGEVVSLDHENIVLKPGQNILTRLYVERHRSGINDIERVLVMDKTTMDGELIQEEQVLDHITRANESGTKNILYVIYDIDFHVRGCGYVYSRSSRSYTWNILTYIKPIVTYSPKIKFCIGE